MVGIDDDGEFDGEFDGDLEGRDELGAFDGLHFLKALACTLHLCYTRKSTNLDVDGVRLGALEVGDLLGFDVGDLLGVEVDGDTEGL